ncbi:LTA synthase family protein [Clostridium perfringens]|uniref:LTA synthase family protein n=1 Tax=Clostridium perfringens TaxID=1502 RepID=UPI000E1A62D9|nr:LTA synthase family protein [Clostridium perfringens]ELP5177778.1 LTA synthase family protein [Clostridium perfringens]MDU3642920.1 LTA synthase family protein [Clostridium perfringens]SUY30081.1 sulfatase family protein [Clostridium perfringens]
MKKNEYRFLSILNNKFLLFFLFSLLIIIKEVFFTWIWSSSDSIAKLQIFNMYMYWPKLLIHIVFAMTIASGIFLFNKNGRIIYILIADIVITILMFLDISYYRNYGNFLSIRHLFHGELFNPLNKELFNFYKRDILLLIDFIILVPLSIFSLKNDSGKKSRRSIKIFILSWIINGIIIYTSHSLVDIKGVTNGKLTLFEKSFAPQVNMDDLGMVGYHEYDLTSYILKKDKKLSTEEKVEINKWFEENKETLPDNKYKGLGKGKNLIIIQWESLENFAINYKVDGQEITPNMNKLLSNSLYFDNIYEQNKNGTTSDAELMANTSLLPISESAYFIQYPWKKQNTLQRLLEKHGYNTATAIADKGGVWNWLENHKSFGVQTIWDSSYFNRDELVGSNITDGSLFRQTEEKIKILKRPYYLFMATATSHGPFDLPTNYRELKLPKVIDDTKLGGYLQSLRYTDKMLGEFLNKLKSDGVLDNSIIVIYGDHGGINKYYKKELENIDFANNNWKQEYLKVPMLIYNPEIKGEVINTYGGLVDLLPTVGYIMGVDKSDFEKTAMGRVLVNTNVNATINSSGQILGNPKDEKEIRHLQDMYKISNNIIESNYFNN